MNDLDSMGSVIGAQATVMLADFAQVVNGRLNLLGAGAREIGAVTPAFGLGALLECAIAGEHSAVLDLLDEHGTPVVLADEPVAVLMRFTVELEEDSALIPLAFNFAGMPLEPGRYQWRLRLDGTLLSTLHFNVRI